MQPGTISTSVPIPTETKPKEEPAPPSVKWRMILGVVGTVLVFIEAIICIALGVVYKKIWVIVLSGVAFLIGVYACISLCGSYRVWNKLMQANKIVLIVVTFICAALATCSICTWNSWQNHGNYTSDESKRKDDKIFLMTVVTFLTIVQYILFLIMFCPIFWLYNEESIRRKG